MAEDMKDFLLKWYKQRHFDLMPAGVRAQYNVYRANNDFAGNMKHWNKELLDANGDSNPLPTLTDPDDLKKLYDMFQDVLLDMDDNRKDFKYEDVSNDFVNKWVSGAEPLFGKVEATPEAESDIEKLRQVLDLQPTDIKSFLEKPDVGLLPATTYVDKKIDFDDFVKGVRDKKYNTDKNFRAVLKNIIGTLASYERFNELPRNDDGSPVFNFNFQHTEQLNNWFQSANYDKDRFERAYPEMLDALLRSEKLRNRFASYGTKHTITEQLTKAINETDYENKNSKDFVPEKLKDKENLAQKIEKLKDDTFENYLRKFTTARGSRIYFTPYSQEIIKAIDKEKVKPTEGIDGILAKRDAIEKRVASKSPNAKGHFSWFADTMAKLKEKMPKAYGNALRNGAQLRAIVSEVIRVAVKDGKIGEAKTALEILSVCKYGFMDSKAMENLKEYFKENKEGVFGNKELSWNKNEGVKFVTGAMDKTVRFGVKAAVQSVASINHLIQKSRTKFRGRKGNLAEDIAKNQTKMDKAKDLGIQIANDKIAAVDAKKAMNDARLADMSIGGVHTKSGWNVNEANLDNCQTELADRAAIRDTRKIDLDAATAALGIAEGAYTPDMQERRNKATNYVATRDALQADIDALNIEIADINAQLGGLGGSAEDFAKANVLYPKLQELMNDRDDKVHKRDDLNAWHAFYMGAGGAAQRMADYNAYHDFENAKNARDAAKADYDFAQAEHANLETDINEYNAKKEENEKLVAEKDAQQGIIDNWDRDHTDKYLELMSYWDTLESPLKVHNFQLATTKMQAEMLKREKKNPLGKEIEMTKAQWRAWNDLQGYRYAA